MKLIMPTDQKDIHINIYVLRQGSNKTGIFLFFSFLFVVVVVVVVVVAAAAESKNLIFMPNFWVFRG